MRVALDYLTFKIVSPAATDLDLIRKTQFPICKDSKDWPGMVGYRLSTLNQAKRDVFAELQPYHGRHAPGLEPLLVLSELESVHKHRHLLDAFPSVTGAGFIGTGFGKIRLTSRTFPSGPLVSDTEVYRYVFVDPDDANVEGKFMVQSHVCFDRSGPACGQVVLTALSDIYKHIRDVVFAKLEPLL